MVLPIAVVQLEEDMATEQQIEKFLIMMEKSKPDKLLEAFDEVEAGIGAVLKILYERNEPVTAGMLSDQLGVSTARVAVLIKKMTAKGLIEKEHPESDARVTIVQLTEPGKSTIEAMRDEYRGRISKLIDTLGEEKLSEYIELSNEIREIMEEPMQKSY